MSELDELLRQHVQDNTPEQAPDFSAVLGRVREPDAAVPSGTGVDHRRRHRQVLVGVAAAAVLAISAWGATLLLGETPDTPPVAQTSAPEAPHPADVPARTGPLPDNGTASCAFEPTSENLAQRAFAFDGTVVAIGPMSGSQEAGGLNYVPVTFQVHSWFTGGTGDQVVIGMSPPVDTGSDLTSELGPSYEVGTRLLVTGEPRWGGEPLDDAVAWGCGFTQYWDSATAAQWGQIFRE